MTDLISRAALLDAIDNERKVLIEEKRLGAEHVIVHHARRIIEELPAVAAVPVVRCWDCVYGCLSKNVRGEDKVFCENPDFEGMDYLVNEPDWYCADGERRESE